MSYGETIRTAYTAAAEDTVDCTVDTLRERLHRIAEALRPDVLLFFPEMIRPTSPQPLPMPGDAEAAVVQAESTREPWEAAIAAQKAWEAERAQTCEDMPEARSPSQSRAARRR